MTRFLLLECLAIAACFARFEITHAANPPQNVRRDTSFYVSPTGQDSWPGTSDRPFATLERARDAARMAGPARTRIVVRGGSYFNVSLVLEPVDSGLTMEAARGEKPILYGGQRILNWKPDSGEFLAADLPPFPRPTAAATEAAQTWQVRMLQVDGQFAEPARYPAEGTLTHLSSFDVPWMSTTGGGWKRAPTRQELTELRYQAGDIREQFDVANAEVTVFHMWDESRVGLAAIDRTNHVLKFSSPAGHPAGAFGVKTYVLWNTRQGMTRPGQWYHDRTRNKIVYWPQPGQDLSKIEIIAPTRDVILKLRGKSAEKVRDVTIAGLTLAVTTVPLKAGGFAAANFDGAVSLQNTENCSLSQLTIARVAGQAVNSHERGDAGLRIEGCDIHDCGAGGIYVGGKNNRFANNLIYRIGRSFPSAVGFYRGGQNNEIVHNEIHDTPYSAITYGGTSNLIAANLIYRCMQTLHDGAAIYIFAGNGVVLRGNFARDIVDTGGYGASAYYLDERSTNCIVEKNLSLGVARPSHNHMATNNVIRENIFIAEHDLTLTFPRCVGFALEKNVFYAGGKISIENPAAVSRWTENIFYSGANRVEQIALKAYSRSGELNQPPPNAILADPLFRDLGKRDLHFEPGSPALRLGISVEAALQAGRELTAQRN